MISASEAVNSVISLSERRHRRRCCIHAARGNADPEREIARLKRQPGRSRARTVLSGSASGVLAATSSISMPPAAEAMKTGLPNSAVEHDAKIKLAFDGQRLLDQQALHHSPLRSGLMSDKRHAEDLLGDLGRFGRVFCDFYAAALAASAGVNLRLNHDAAAELLGCGLGFLYGVGALRPAAQGRCIWPVWPWPDTREFSYWNWVGRRNESTPRPFDSVSRTGDSNPGPAYTRCRQATSYNADQHLQISADSVTIAPTSVVF